MGGRWRALKPGPSGEGAGSGEPPGPPRPDPRAVVARGWTRRCGCCSIRLCPGSSVRSREAWGPALPGRRPCGPRVFPRSRRRPPQRAPSPAGASAAEPARRTRARSPRRCCPDKDCAGGWRAPRGDLALASLPLSPAAELGRRCVAAAGQGLAAPSRSFCVAEPVAVW